MKFKIMLIFFLLFLTIGTINASDNVTDVVGQTDSDMLEDSSFYDDDFYITVPENYTHDKTDWDSNYIVYISSSSQKNGTFEVSVDGNKKENFNITDGYFSSEIDENGGNYNKYFKYIYPTDLGLDCGKYNIQVKFNQDILIDAYSTLKEKDDFDIYIPENYYNEKDSWQYYPLIIIDSNHFNNGNLEILINNTLKLSYLVSNGYFEEDPTTNNRSRYVYPQNLGLDYGNYNISVKFNETVLKQVNLDVLEFEPTKNPKLELYFGSYTQHLRDDNMAYIYLPREATGKLTIKYNDHLFDVDYSKGYAYHTIYSWNVQYLGETTVTVTYTGDDFGTLTTSEILTVTPTVNAPAYVSIGEEFSLSMVTHEWVYDGQFNVYEYDGNVKGKLLASNVINGGVSSLKLSSNTIGLNKYYLEFITGGSGTYHIIQEINVFKNTEKLIVDIPSNIKSDETLTINIQGPESYNFVYVSVDNGESEFISMKDGKIVKNISNLAVGNHKISIKYNDFDNPYSNTFNVLVGTVTKISAPQIKTVYNIAKNLVITLKDDKDNNIAGKRITINLNGKNYERITDNNGQVKISANLNVKTYTAVIIFNGDGKYLPAKNNAKIIISKATPKIKVKKFTFKSKTKTKKVSLTLKDNTERVMKNVKVTLKVNGKKYSAKTNNKGIATFKVKLNKKGKFKAIYKYAGNINYKAISKTSKIIVKK